PAAGVFTRRSVVRRRARRAFALGRLAARGALRGIAGRSALVANITLRCRFRHPGIAWRPAASTPAAARRLGRRTLIRRALRDFDHGYIPRRCRLRGLGFAAFGSSRAPYEGGP